MRTVILSLVIWASSAAAQQPPDTPTALRVAADQESILKAHGKGNQVYTCRAPGADSGYTWTLKGPDAQLFDSSSKLVAKHYAGPTWEANDGSSVQGKLVASAPSRDPHAIPWLLLSAATHSGNGIMTKVGSIQRLHTVGGKAPSTGCDSAHVGSDVSVQYEADYYFYTAPPR